MEIPELKITASHLTNFKQNCLYNNYYVICPGIMNSKPWIIIKKGNLVKYISNAGVGMYYAMLMQH